MIPSSKQHLMSHFIVWSTGWPVVDRKSHALVRLAICILLDAKTPENSSIF